MKRSTTTRLAGVAALGVGVLWVGPCVWMLVTSLKPLAEIVGDPAALPTRLTLDAYREVFSAVPVVRQTLVTAFVAAAIALAQIALALPAGYALGKLRFRGRRVAWALVLACLLVPEQVTFVPVFLLLAKAGLVNTLIALIVPFAASAFGIFLVRQALDAVPDELIEAARLDGASELVIVYRILAPLVAPTLVAFALVSFVFHYNDYFWPLVMTTDDSVRTLPLGIALLREPGTGVRWHVVMAGSVVLSLPMLALFAVLQKHLVRAAAGE
ncbi:MAG TPA: carbohydrate ABC transporter permease [Polyangiaceae bacterium]|nr:carbohydrate ABC transporter permease [Polyangiaceae bacterium]